MFLVIFRRVACPQRACARRSVFLTNAFPFRAFARPERNGNERIPSPPSRDEGPVARRDSGFDDEETGEDHEASVEADGMHSKSGARRTGQPRPGAPGSRPRIGSAADFLLFFTPCALRFTSFFSSPRRAIIRAIRPQGNVCGCLWRVIPSIRQQSFRMLSRHAARFGKSCIHAGVPF